VAEVGSLQNWIESARQGDEQAFLRIYRTYSSKVRGLLVQLLGPENLDDYSQEVFVRVWKGLRALREPEAFSGWIYRTTWNVAMSVRKRSAQKKAQFKELVLAESFAPRKTEPDTSLSAKILVERALQSLDFDHRGVVVLVDLEDFSLESAAQIMNVPVGTAKSRLFYARKRLREYLEREGITP
jgi:RNA polymerase sigma-70 factor (ECF subfamily)